MWQLVAAQQCGSAARGALSSGSRSPPAETEAEPLPSSEAIDPHALPAATWVDPEGWLEASGWDTSAPDTSGQISSEVFNLAEEDEVLEAAEEATEPRGRVLIESHRRRRPPRRGCSLRRTGGAQRGNLNSQKRTPRLRRGFAKRFL